MTDEIGAQFDQPDVRGWLTFKHLPAHIQRREDATAAADHARGYPRGDYEQPAPVFTRPATRAERILLQHLGYALPDELTTRVEWITPRVRNRRWPQLEGSTP